MSGPDSSGMAPARDRGRQVDAAVDYSCGAARLSYAPDHPLSMYAAPRTIHPAPSNLSESPVASPDAALSLASRLGLDRRASNSDKPPIRFESVQLDVDLVCEGHIVDVFIDGLIDNKNFFLADHIWTCYRRNYFAVTCSYALEPSCTDKPLHLQRRSENQHAHPPIQQVQALAMTVSATIDRASGKRVELTQLTAKRDNGPQLEIGLRKLLPKSRDEHRTAYHNRLGSTGPLLPLQSLPENLPPDSSSSAQSSTHTFSRIQYKSATLNNGRRRAAQQYYHIVVELWADVRRSPDRPEDWVKIGDRISEQMVVRGRSPRHYLEARHDPSSGPGGPGSGGSLSNTRRHRSPAWPGPSGSTAPTRAFPFIDGASGSNYGPYRSNTFPHPSSSHHAFSSPVTHHLTPTSPQIREDIMTAEDSAILHRYEGYQYYPGPAIYHHNGSFDDPQDVQNRHAMTFPLAVSQYGNGELVVKEEEEQDAHRLLNRYNGCRVFQGFATSSGHYPGLGTTTGF